MLSTSLLSLSLLSSNFLLIITPFLFSLLSVFLFPLLNAFSISLLDVFPLKALEDVRDNRRINKPLYKIDATIAAL